MRPLPLFWAAALALIAVTLIAVIPQSGTHILRTISAARTVTKSHAHITLGPRG